ncbi:MAG: phosphatase PAP2 family protein [Minisyncoccia bacterium]
MVRDFFEGTLRNLLSIYTGINLAWHLLAALFTAGLVLSGADWRFFEATRFDALTPIILIAGIGGFFTPVIIPVGLYVYGEFRRNRHLVQMGAAAGQASVLAYFVTIIYKAFTGRTEPEFLTHYITADYSRDFNFGIIEHGVFWGWPSSHTAVAFAGALTIALMTRNQSLRIAVLSGAVFIAFGAAVGFHWISDVVAGVILGCVVGVVVARYFSKKQK